MSEQQQTILKPFVREMIDEVTRDQTGPVSNTEIVNRIKQRWPDTNEATIRTTIIIMSVNHDSRIHYPENSKPRIANTDVDLLWRIEKGGGMVERYNTGKHGQWEIAESVDKQLFVREVGGLAPPFDRVFSSKEEARRTFGYFREILEYVGCVNGQSGKGLPYWSSFRQVGQGRMRLNIGLGFITIAAFRGCGGDDSRFLVLFPADKPDPHIRSVKNVFKASPGRPALAIGRTGLDDFADVNSEFRKVVFSALAEARETQGATNLGKGIGPYSEALVKMAFDSELLETALDKGLTGWLGDGKLCQEFKGIFKEWRNACFFFDELASTLEILGITSGDQEDQKLAITKPAGSPPRIHVNYGQFLIFGQSAKEGLYLCLRIDMVKPEWDMIHPFGAGFSEGISDPVYNLYKIAPGIPEDTFSEILDIYHATLAEVKERFASWKASNYRKFHNQILQGMCFDAEMRTEMLTKGLGEIAPVDRLPERCFELLQELADNPTAACYQKNKEELRLCLQEPMARLMNRVAEKLPAEMKDILETSKRIFSRILKNDYGQGGAWPHYWGAYYIKGKKRTEHVQLYVWLNNERLSYGFYLNDKSDGDVHDLFNRNISKNRDLLLKLMQPALDTPSTIFGYGKEEDMTDEIMSSLPKSVREWMDQPGSKESIVRRMVPEQATAISLEELADEISGFFKNLHPLIIAACEEDAEPSLRKLLPQPDPPVISPPLNPHYSIEQIAEETKLSLEMLQRWGRSIHRKGQAVFYGPPGTGKTFIAEKFARHLVGGGDGIVELVQFHPAYAYEDFMQGIRPDSQDGQLTYSIHKGRFLQFCEEAQKRSGHSVLIIDEINRANIAQVFGELMYLLEYRDRQIPLAAGGKLSIPAQVRILGTMNTADRSIALVDHALRRRFAFLQLQPSYDALRAHFGQRNFDANGLVSALQKVNDTIGDPNYAIGISYFIHRDPHKHFEDIWKMEIEPYLDELFFDQPTKVDLLRWERIRNEVIR